MKSEQGLQEECADLGNRGRPRKLTIQVEERAVGVLADPSALRQLGTAAPLLALVNERCGDGQQCRIKYADVARDLGVSTTTLKAWSESLEKLGYYTRTPCGPAGVDIRLCSDAWPSRDAGTTVMDTLRDIADVLDALRVTLDRALDSAASDVRRVLGVAA